MEVGNRSRKDEAGVGQRESGSGEITGFFWGVAYLWDHTKFLKGKFVTIKNENSN